MDKIDDGDAVNLSTGIYTSFIEFARHGRRTCAAIRPEVSGMSDKPAGVHARGGDTQKQKRWDSNTNRFSGWRRARA